MSGFAPGEYNSPLVAVFRDTNRLISYTVLLTYRGLGLCAEDVAEQSELDVKSAEEALWELADTPFVEVDESEKETSFR